MIRYLTLCIPLLFFLPAPTPADEPAHRPITIVTLGDSITKGARTGVTPDQTFSALLHTKLKDGSHSIRVLNVGIGGERTDQALKRLDQILELNPDVVTVMYGTNDSYIDPGQTASRITLDEYRQNLTKLVIELLRRGITPVLMTEPRWSDDASPNGLGENPNVRLEPYVAACRETAHTWRVPLVDHYARWTESRDKGTNLRTWTTDGCHPNPAGHAELTAAMLPVIVAVIAPRDAARVAEGVGRPTTAPTPVPNRAASQKLLQSGKLRVVCFGDSVTGVYYHTGSRRAYTDMVGIALRRLAPNANVEMINAGISGHTTADGLARLERDVLSHKPDVVTVMFGLNDMTRLSLDQYRANLQEIAKKCRAAGSEVIFATPNNVITTPERPTEKLIQYCDAIRDVARDLKVPVCDIYRELEAVRAHDPLAWRLLMSDSIHPNMAGHKRIATALAHTITGIRVPLDDVPPLQEKLALTHSVELLRAKKPLRILAMPPFDEFIKPAIQDLYPAAQITVDSWQVTGRSLSQIEQDAKSRVRQLKPDLVLIAIPRSATADTDESFISSYAWTMNWSLAFGPPTWDCVVVHPSVTAQSDKPAPRDDLIRQLVRSQDLPLVDRAPDNEADTATLFLNWIKPNLAPMQRR